MRAEKKRQKAFCKDNPFRRKRKQKCKEKRLLLRTEWERVGHHLDAERVKKKKRNPKQVPPKFKDKQTGDEKRQPTLQTTRD